MFRSSVGLAEAVSRPARVRARPVHLQIEPVNRCNMACASCKPAGLGRAPDMKRADFERLIETVDPGYVTLSGMGEPLLHPDLPAMIRRLKDRGAAVNTTTNGVLLARRAEELVASGLDLLSVSLDAATPETYARLRQARFFDQVREGVTALARAKQRSGKGPVIRTSLVINSENIYEIESFLEESAALGAEVVLYQVLDPQDIADPGLKLPGPDRLRVNLERAARTARRLKLPTNLPVLLKNLALIAGPDPAPRLARPCRIVWFSAYVAADLEIRPCCKFAAVPEMTVGRIDFERPLAAFNQAPFARFRRELRRGRRPHPVCRECLPETIWEMLASRRRF